MLEQAAVDEKQHAKEKHLNERKQPRHAKDQKKTELPNNPGSLFLDPLVLQPNSHTY